jgi:hypothetical protein
MENEETNPTLNKIEEFLEEIIQRLEPIRSDPVGRGRPRVLPAMCLWAGVIVCVLRGWNSQLGIWRLLSKRGLWNYPRFPVSDQAVYKRLEKGGVEPLRELFQWVSQALERHLAPYQQKIASFASEVVAIDATTLDKVYRHLPALREVPNGDDQLLPGKLGAVYDIRMQQWRYIEYVENPHANDKSYCRDLLDHIQREALILMDLGFFSFEWFDQLTSEGYFWISRLRQRTTYEVLHTFYQDGETFDGLVWLGIFRADRARYAVRLVTFRVGEMHYQYITNVTHPTLLSLHDIAVLYARRWDIELAFKLIKRELDLHMFWSGKLVVVLQQVWAVLLISQILHAIQLEIAGRAGVDPFDVSITLLVEYLPGWNDVDFIKLVVEDGRDAGFIRPSRRIRIKTPPIELSAYSPPPPDLVVVRPPRYAHRRSIRDQSP